MSDGSMVLRYRVCRLSLSARAKVFWTVSRYGLLVQSTFDVRYIGAHGRYFDVRFEIVRPDKIDEWKAGSVQVYRKSPWWFRFWLWKLRLSEFYSWHLDKRWMY